MKVLVIYKGCIFLKKGIVFLVIMIILFQGVFFIKDIRCDEGIKIKNYWYKRGGEKVAKIYPNEKFDLVLDLDLPKNSKYNLIIEENASFTSPISNGEEYIFKNLNSGELTIPLYYDGGNDTELKIIFTDGKDFIEKSIRIDIASESTSTTYTSRNPKIIISGGSMPVFNGGEDAKLNIPIENIGSVLAKDIQIILQMDENSPFEVEKLNLTYTIDRINSKKSDNALFKIKVHNNAEEKVYPIKVRYYYSNMAGEVFEGSDIINIRVQNSKKPPKLILSAIGYGDTPLIVNEMNTVSAIIRNTGALDAKDIKVTLKGLSSNGFTLYKSSDVKQLPDISANKVMQIDYILIPSINMETGNYDLGLKIDYKDNKNTTYSDEMSFFLPVKGLDSSLSNIVIENISIPDREIKAEENFKISFDIINKSIVEADDVRVSLNTDKDIICKSLNINSIGKLEKDQSKRIEFELYATTDALTKNYPIQINIDFENGTGDKKVKNNINQYVGVYINRGSGSSTPRIIVDRYFIEPSIIKAGDAFQLTMSLLNTSSSGIVSNIKVSLSSDDGVFNPVDSSNTIFIEKINSKDNIQKVFTLAPRIDAEHKTYGISIDIEYEDEKGNQLSAKDTISIPVIQQAKLVLGDLIVPPEAFLGQVFPVSIEFFNMGKTILHNLMIKTEGDFGKQNSNYYVGNFEPGSVDSYDVGIIPEEEGFLRGSIVFSFENAVGEIYDVIKEFEVNIIQMPMEPMPENGFDGEFYDDGSKNKFMKIIKNPYIIGIFILLAIGIILKAKKVYKKKREMTLDE